uniref:Zonular occludens toxin n=1 Tax=Elaeophora elaphi TaxID=1147741 RepID=A0A0R3RJZ3_9BILA
MCSKNELSGPDFLSSRETYEKYERPHNRNFGHVPIALSSVTPVTYLNEYKVITRTPISQDEVMVPMPHEQVISKQNLQPLTKKRIPFGRVIAAAIAIPLFVMFFLFIAVWFQELGFI